MDRTFCLLACLVLISVGGGCRSPAEGGDRSKAAAGVRVNAGAISPAELRERLKDFNGRFSLGIQVAANEIAARSTENTVRQRTVYWKLFTIPFCRDAVFQENPVAALVDTWVLCVQERDFFESGDGRESFGEHTGVAVEAVRMLEADVRRIAAEVLESDRYPEVEEAVRAFAHGHPIRGPFARESTRPAMVDASSDTNLLDILGVPLVPLRAVGGLDQTAQAISEVSSAMDEFTTLVSYLPEEIRWHTELLAYDLEGRESVTSALNSFETFSKSASRLSETAEKLPGELRKEVAATLEELEDKQLGLRETLKEARTTLAEMNTALRLVERTSEQLARSGAAWEAAVRALWEMIRDLSGDEEGSEAQAEAESEPFDIKDYARTAEGIASAALELRSATAEVRKLIASDETRSAIDETDTRVRSLINHAAGLCVLLIVVFFAAAMSYRFVSARITRREKRITRREK